jgi:hypothetical protein
MSLFDTSTKLTVHAANPENLGYRFPKVRIQQDTKEDHRELPHLDVFLCL